jgi:hypothetical protein
MGDTSPLYTYMGHPCGGACKFIRKIWLGAQKEWTLLDDDGIYMNTDRKLE